MVSTNSSDKRTSLKSGKNLGASTKVGKCINLGSWKDMLEDFNKYPSAPVKGYSTADEIAIFTGRSSATLYRQLKKMRELGQIEAIKARIKDGKIVWVYKD